jgi:hypothetical protein
MQSASYVPTRKTEPNLRKASSSSTSVTRLHTLASAVTEAQLNIFVWRASENAQKLFMKNEFEYSRWQVANV